VKAFTDKLILMDTHANPDPQRDNLVPDISVHANNNVPATNTKMHLSMMELFICWDHGSANVTRIFDYIKEPHLFPWLLALALLTSQ
jgi:hypothetical protein